MVQLLIAVPFLVVQLQLLDHVQNQFMLIMLKHLELHLPFHLALVALKFGQLVLAVS